MADEIEKLTGVGEKTAEKMKEAGYNDYMSIAAASSGELVGSVGVGENTANRIIASAREALNMGFESVASGPLVRSSYRADNMISA